MGSAVPPWSRQERIVPSLFRHHSIIQRCCRYFPWREQSQSGRRATSWGKREAAGKLGWSELNIPRLVSNGADEEGFGGRDWKQDAGAETAADPDLGSALSTRLPSTLPARHRMQNTKAEIVLRDLQKLLYSLMRYCVTFGDSSIPGLRWQPAIPDGK